jgi:hypothetical protein
MCWYKRKLHIRPPFRVLNATAIDVYFVCVVPLAVTVNG